MTSSSKTNTTDRIPFNFTCYALKLLGQNLYSNPWTAVSELVANGIDAKASCVYVLVDLTDKANAQIEVIDNGHGMGYDDLCEKYTIIGRNKRINAPNDKSVLGRKGIGKLAALYLSSKYYLYSKTVNEQSSWVVDISDVMDADFPYMDRYNGADQIVANELWKTINTGTLVRLTNVDLKKVGIERLKALPIILSDYYLSDFIKCEIRVCVRMNSDEKIVFSPAEKRISYSTLYSIFDNTGLGYKDRLKQSVYLTKPFELPAEIDYPDSTISMTEFENTSGELDIQSFDNDIIKANYQLKGWIGIHASLDNDVQRRNNPEFNRVIYHPNAIRLYVRGKLAVDNLMTYINNSQAFANYIEGEISFDILDDDRFEDISTSNREGYRKDDIRVVKLLDIVNRIVNKLIGDRSDAGTAINNRLKEYNQRKQEQGEKERQELAQELQISKSKAETAIRDKDIAIARAEVERKRIDYIVSVSNVENNNVLPSMHSIYNLSSLEKKRLSTFERYWDTLPAKLKSTVESLGEINNQILYISKAISKSNYLIDSEEKTTDICDFISEYIARIARKVYGSKIRMQVIDNLTQRLVIRVNTINLATIVENIIGNAIKANAKSLQIEYVSKADTTLISFSDDGDGLNQLIDDISQVFEFGFTTTSGAGLGLYYSKKYIENMGGKLTAKPNLSRGLCFTAEWETKEGKADEPKVQCGNN